MTNPTEVIVKTPDYEGPERREHVTTCPIGVEMRVRVMNLENYQKIQNGHLKTIRGQQWALVILMLTTALSAIAGIAITLIH